MIFSCFKWKLKEKVGGLLGVGGVGAKGMLASPPSKIIGGLNPPPLPLFLRLCNIKPFKDLNCEKVLLTKRPLFFISVIGILETFLVVVILPLLQLPTLQAPDCLQVP